MEWILSRSMCMPKLIDTKGIPVANPWVLLARDSTIDQALAESASHIMVPAELWLGAKPALLASGKNIAVWLDSDQQVSMIRNDLHHFPVIALNFPAFMDGRSYSSAVSLRQHYGYQGEIRAIGDVLRDQLFYQKRCGFTTFDLRDSVLLSDAASAMQDFSDSYQATVEQPLPLFKRRNVS